MHDSIKYSSSLYYLPNIFCMRNKQKFTHTHIQTQTLTQSECEKLCCNSVKYQVQYTNNHESMT